MQFMLNEYINARPLCQAALRTMEATINPLRRAETASCVLELDQAQNGKMPIFGTSESAATFPLSQYLFSPLDAWLQT